MLLVIDAGNTNIVFALYDRRVQKWLAEWRLQTIHQRAQDEYHAILVEWFSRIGIKFEQIEAVIASSVVPLIDKDLKFLSEEYLKCDFKMIGVDNFMPDMEVMIDNPSELGADRLINAWQAYRQYHVKGHGLVVIDFGTATTFDVVDNQGRYIGGIIAPGIELSMRALAKAAAKLSMSDFAKPKNIIGTNTEDAMRSGFFYSIIATVEKMIAGIKKQNPDINTVLATGGLAQMVAGEIADIHVDNHLILNGLMALYQQENLTNINIKTREAN